MYLFLFDLLHFRLVVWAGGCIRLHGGVLMHFHSNVHHDEGVGAVEPALRLRRRIRGRIPEKAPAAHVNGPQSLTTNCQENTKPCKPTVFCSVPNINLTIQDEYEHFCVLDKHYSLPISISIQDPSMNVHKTMCKYLCK